MTKEDQLEVRPTMTFEEKREELELLGASCKFLYLEGNIRKMVGVDLYGTIELIRQRCLRLFDSMTPVEKSLALLLSPAQLRDLQKRAGKFSL